MVSRAVGGAGLLLHAAAARGHEGVQQRRPDRAGVLEPGADRLRRAAAGPGLLAGAARGRPALLLLLQHRPERPHALAVHGSRASGLRRG